jgi:hypothetical protein
MPALAREGAARRSRTAQVAPRQPLLHTHAPAAQAPFKLPGSQVVSRSIAAAAQHG